MLLSSTRAFSFWQTGCVLVALAGVACMFVASHRGATNSTGCGSVLALNEGTGVRVNQVGNSEQRIRQILGEHAGLSVDVTILDVGADLYAAGMSSRASVSVMLALESTFEIEFPDAMLRREVFASMAAISAAIEQIRAGA